MELETCIDINASPERVWEVLTDFEEHPQWNPLIRELRGRLAMGEELYVRLGPPDQKPMTFRPRVVELDEGAEPRFAWRGKILAGWIFAGVHRFALERLAEGSTRFYHSEQFGGLLIPMLKTTLRQDLRRAFELMNEALKQKAEGSTASQESSAD